MHLTNKTLIYFNSSQKLQGGTQGNFNVSVPFQLEYGKNVSYRIYFQEIQLFNDFPAIDATTNTLVYNLAGAPSHTITLDIGSYSLSQLIAELNAKFAATSGTPARYFTASPGNDGILNGGQAVTFDFVQSTVPSSVLGFPRQTGVYTWQANAPTDTLPFSGNRAALVQVHTNLPFSRLEIAGSTGLSQSSITAQIPVLVPLGGFMVYRDLHGANAMFEYARDAINNISIRLTDAYGAQLLPYRDSFYTLAIERWENTDTEVIEALEQSNGTSEKSLALQKIELLGRSLKRRRGADDMME